MSIKMTTINQAFRRKKNILKKKKKKGLKKIF